MRPGRSAGKYLRAAAAGLWSRMCCAVLCLLQAWHTGVAAGTATHCQRPPPVPSRFTGLAKSALGLSVRPGTGGAARMPPVCRIRVPRCAAG